MCANHLTDVENMLNGKDKHKNSKMNLKAVVKSNFRRFGELAVIKTANKIQGKLTNKGTLCMFVGLAEEHPSDTL